MKNQIQLTVESNTELETIITVPSFCGIPLVGMNEIPGHIQLIVTDWSGYATGIITRRQFPGSGRLLENLYKKRPKAFEPGDKGCFTIYGVNQFGCVSFGCAVYPGEASFNPSQRVQHLLIATCKKVSPWQ